MDDKQQTALSPSQRSLHPYRDACCTEYTEAPLRSVRGHTQQTSMGAFASADLTQAPLPVRQIGLCLTV